LLAFGKIGVWGFIGWTEAHNNLCTTDNRKDCIKAEPVLGIVIREPEGVVRSRNHGLSEYDEKIVDSVV
jgi:hypothetical protein